MRAKVFAPGHITGFFYPHIDSDPEKSGSYGAGICLSLGAVAEVEISEGKGIEIHGVEGNVTERALLMAKNELGLEKKITVRIELQLPISQGFGMSAAGTLAASLALAHLSGVDRHDALRWTHTAEVESKTGLSDAIASYHGGLIIRKRPGLPPYGEVEKIDIDSEIGIIVVGEPVRTDEVLKDPEVLVRIENSGRKSLENFMKDKSLENFMRVSREFASSIGISNILDRIPEGKLGSQAMLGNSVFFIDGDASIRCNIDNQGVRVIG